MTTVQQTLNTYLPNSFFGNDYFTVTVNPNNTVTITLTIPTEYATLFYNILSSLQVSMK